MLVDSAIRPDIRRAFIVNFSYLLQGRRLNKGA